MSSRLVRRARTSTPAVLAGELWRMSRRIGKFADGASTEHRLRRRASAFGPSSRINGSVEITGIEKLEIGNNVHIGDGGLIRAEGGVRISDNTHIARNVIIYSHNHEYEGACLPYDEGLRLRPVVIGRNVWVGIGVTILPGASIGDGAIVGAGSIVAGTVEPLTIVGGLTQRLLAERNREHYHRLEAGRKYGGKKGRPLC